MSEMDAIFKNQGSYRFPDSVYRTHTALSSFTLVKDRLKNSRELARRWSLADVSKDVLYSVEDCSFRVHTA